MKKNQIPKWVLALEELEEEVEAEVAGVDAV